MIALGLSNVAGAFVGSIPISGSFTRSAINNTSGVKTPFGGFFTGKYFPRVSSHFSTSFHIEFARAGLLVLMALGFMTELFYYIPKATLAGLIITAMMFMVEYHTIAVIWRTKSELEYVFKTKRFVCRDFMKNFLLYRIRHTATVCCFLSLSVFQYWSGNARWHCDESVFHFVFQRQTINQIELVDGKKIRSRITVIHHTYPRNATDYCRFHMCSQVNVHKLVYFQPKQSLLFPASDYLREKIVESCTKSDDYSFVVLDGSLIYRIDTTTAKVGVKNILAR